LDIPKEEEHYAHQILATNPGYIALAET
jgi:hypothetical protein